MIMIILINLVTTTYFMISLTLLPVFSVDYRDHRGLQQNQYLRILLENSAGKQLILDYQLERHSIALKFSKLIKRILLNSQYEIKHTAWAVYPSGDEAKRILYDSIQSNIKYFDENNGVGLKFKNYLPPFETFTSKDLNLVHSDFERLITKTFEVPTGKHNLGQTMVTFNKSEDVILKLEDSLNAVNGRIHALEHVLMRTGSNSFFTTYLKSDPHVKEIALNKDEYKYFRLDNDWGGLYLGYGTTGKSLYHLFKDKDLALVHAGGRPSPQEVVTSNILAVFYETSPHEVVFQEMVDWLEKHEVGKRLGLNITDPLNAHGYAKLGQLVLPPKWQNLTKNDIISKISPYDKIIRYFIA